MSDYSFQREITEKMVDDFAALSGDYNPVHMDEAFCREHGMETRVAHGMLVLSLVSTLIGMYLPGRGAVWLSQSFDFVNPARIGDTLAVSGKITGASSDNLLGRPVYTIAVKVVNQNMDLIVRGKCKVTVK